MYILHMALGGCLSAPPVDYGLTEDTGGHIGYVLGAAMAQAARSDVSRVDIVTRAFDGFGARYLAATERVSEKCSIRRLFTGNPEYLEKEGLAREIAPLGDAFLAQLEAGPRPDVIHAHFADAASIAQRAAERFAIPWIYTPHSLALDKQASLGPDAAELDARIAQERAAIRGASAIIVSSRDEAERQISAYDEDAAGRCHRVNPGVMLAENTGTAAAQQLIAPLLDAPQKPIILAIARPVRKKNLAGLVRAYAESPALQARANLVILAGQREGDGPPGSVMRELTDLARDPRLKGRFALPPRHSQKEVRALYALAARNGVFVNPAFNEPFGLTLVEAAQAGVPLVATRIGGPVDILPEIGQGVLVNPHDGRAIIQACKTQLSTGASEHAADAVPRARALFDWDRWAARSLEIIRGLGARRIAPRRATHLFASDIDGTLTGCATGAREFSRWCSERPHVRFACVTGRSIGEAQRVLAWWNLPEPEVFITSVGSEIWRRGTRGLLLCHDYAARIDRDWLPMEVARIAAELGLASQPDYEQRRWKVSFIGSATQAESLKAAMDAAGLQGHVIASHERFIDVLPAEAGKAAAIRFELARMSLSPDECMVAGDSGNDRDMLEYFAQAVVPSNAYAELAQLRNPGLHRSKLAHARGILDGLRAFETRSAAALTVAA
ncbi:HAD family hydrolase [Sulfitobacter aestuarii]|uniref:sucrose-phosphate synthase n=1 Tax=Sulfitobacter aestuarii TaxID=2161676 RepID=A0ABW5U576_9RHOB